MTGPRDNALRRAVDGAADRLAEAGVPSPQYDALALAAHVLGLPRLILALAPEPPADFQARYEIVLAERERRVPLQQIVGSAPFRYLEVPVAEGVFIPRPETELVAGFAIDAAAALRSALVVDLCTGTGAIALALATEVPTARVVAVDVSDDAVFLATESAAALGAEVSVRAGDVSDSRLLADLDGLVDVVVSNPPYLPPPTQPLAPEVSEHDPPAALYGGGPDGLDVPRLVIAAGARLLRPGGVFVLEHDDSQGTAIREIVAATGFDQVRTHRDLAGRDRFVSAVR